VTVLARAKKEGVVISAFGSRKIRLATHLSVSRHQCKVAGDILANVIESG
jgi:hypothetical protein